MITPEEVRKELQHYVSEYGMDYYGEKHFPITTKYLLQQEKKDKLLKLYKTIATEPYEVDYSVYWKQIKALEIKALEEELK